MKQDCTPPITLKAAIKMIKPELYLELKKKLGLHGTQLLIVSKNQSIEDILAYYQLGHRSFGENKVQQLLEKKEKLPKDIEWHLIGPLQKNKIKYIASWIHCIQSVDSLELAVAIDTWAKKEGRVIQILAEVKIAKEQTKHGFTMNALESSIRNNFWTELTNLKFTGLMGMASYIEDSHQIANEFASLSTFFRHLKATYPSCKEISVLSMGMSGDYSIAIAQGSTLVRIGSMLFTQ